MTITSGISPSTYAAAGPQKWLDSLVDDFLAAADSELSRVRFTNLQSQDVFVRRCFVSLELSGVQSLVAQARARAVEGEDAGPGPKTEAWMRDWVARFGPHVSLM